MAAFTSGGQGCTDTPNTFVIIGGGIGGVTVAEELLSLLPEGSADITIITASPILKQVREAAQQEW
jgi:NADH dehydrogenase FAD-containing subunit